MQASAVRLGDSTRDRCSGVLVEVAGPIPQRIHLSAIAVIRPVADVLVVKGNISDKINGFSRERKLGWVD